MCECGEPQRHYCGSFGQLVGELGKLDVYWCPVCEKNFMKHCDLLISSSGVCMAVRGGDGSVETA